MSEQENLVTGRLVRSQYNGRPDRLILISFCALIGAFNFGVSVGYSSPAIPSLLRKGIINEDESGWFGSLLTIGALIGGTFGGWFMDKAGRKNALILLSVPFVLGYFSLSSATVKEHCFLGRFLTGISSGMVTVCIPIYIAEISTSSMRGMLGACVQLLITIGIAAAYIVGAFTEWRFLSTLALAPCVLGVVAIFFISETPRWLLLKDRKAEAFSALKTMRDPQSDVSEEWREIEEAAGPEESVTFSELLRKPELRYPVFLGVSVMIFQQLTGINVVMFYSVSIFKSAVSEFAEVASIILGVVQVFATLFAVYMMDKAGRIKLLKIGGCLMAVTLFCFGLFYRMADNDYIVEGFIKTWLPVLCLNLYIVGFSIGWGPIPMLMMSEILPSKAKGIAGSLAVLGSWGSAFFITSQFNFMRESLGRDGVFYFYSVSCFIGVMFVVKLVPETKGKSLKDIENFFQKTNTVNI